MWVAVVGPVLVRSALGSGGRVVWGLWRCSHRGKPVHMGSMVDFLGFGRRFPLYLVVQCAPFVVRVVTVCVCPVNVTRSVSALVRPSILPLTVCLLLPFFALAS